MVGVSILFTWQLIVGSVGDGYSSAETGCKNLGVARLILAAVGVDARIYLARSPIPNILLGLNV